MMSRFIPLGRGRDIEPGEDFIEQMRSHLDDPVSECGFVPCPHRRVDYSNLDPAQLSYYIFWRDSLRNGKVLRSD